MAVRTRVLTMNEPHPRVTLSARGKVSENFTEQVTEALRTDRKQVSILKQRTESREKHIESAGAQVSFQVEDFDLNRLA